MSTTPQPFKNVKSILSSGTLHKQAVGWIWPMDPSLLTPENVIRQKVITFGCISQRFHLGWVFKDGFDWDF